MAMTHDYLDFLNQRVDIAPANSQEELQAAETIATLMSQHNVEPSIEEFDAPSLSGLGAAILAIVAFVGVLVSGFGILVLTLVGLLLAAIPAIVAIMRLFGREPSLTLGPQARSQNVVAVHRATGPLVTKGSRRIVVIAHYDTPRENFLYTSPLAPYLPLLVKASAPCSYAAAVCALVQLLGFIPAPARVIVWILGILACVPGLVVAAGAIHERMSSCTLGANDNKSGVAALLGVMENVRPSGLVPTPREPEQSRDLEEIEDAEETPGEPADEVDEPSSAPFEHVSARPAPVEVVGVRHGEEVLRELQILPETCEIEYYVPEPAPAPAPSFRPTSLPLVDSVPAVEEDTPEAEEETISDVPVESPIAGALESLKRVVLGAKNRLQALVRPKDTQVSEEEHQDIARGGAAAVAARAAHDSDHAPATSYESVPAADDRAPSAQELDNEPETTPEFEAEIEEILAAPAPEPETFDDDLDEPEPAEPETLDADLDEPEPEVFDDDLDEPEPSETAPIDVAPEEGEPEDEADIEGTTPMRPVSAGEVSREDIMSTGKFSIVMDDESRGVGPKDTSGLTAIDESTLDIDQPAPKRPRPSAPDDPEWGKASFRPSVSNVARRATLFDLPDPEGNEVDPLGDPSTTASARRTSPAPETVMRSDAPEETVDAPVISSPQPIETLASEHRKSAGSGFLGKLKGMFSGKGDAESSWLGSDDSDEDRTWRGGAATRSGLRLVGEDEGAPSDDELRGAALSLGDEALIAHDIWFVALGGSSLDHAGMRSFLAEHRSEIRGSFVINLDCVGAGDLTLLTHEGRTVKRRADRRLGRILTNVAKDVHVELGQRDFSWTSTDAWVAMRSSLRALTIMGVDENGLPALSHTPMDDPENVSGDQTALVAEMVTEAIRRS